MNDTHFDDSSGLPSPTHYTTARDISKLARALLHDFPEYYPLFSIREFVWNNIRQQNRNGLLERDPSVDGMKTGHTDSAGFCLVTSARRQGMRLITVVLGSASIQAPRGRERRAAELRLHVLPDRHASSSAGAVGAQAARLQGRTRSTSRVGAGHATWTSSCRAARPAASRPPRA